MTNRSPALCSADSRLPLPAPRTGFTIIELLMVVLIIGVLIALLFPAIGSALRNAREAEVVVEIKAFEKAITDFKSRFGIEPPSFMVLYEDGADWDPSSPAVGVSDQQRRACRATIRQIWPDFAFAADIDLDRDGTSGESGVFVTLNGAECLVLFLAGVTTFVDTDADGTNDTYAPQGFAANPQTPFGAGGNRIGPFHEFDVDRLVDLDGDGMPEFLDSLPGQDAPYLYLSSYDGRGYQQFGLDFDCTGPSGVGNADDELPPGTLTDMYYLSYTDACTNEPLNPNTCQIISPGEDFEYGTGGVYNDEGVGSARPYDRDNITNFKGGRLN
jgi:general secretion pathway protein G